MKQWDYIGKETKEKHIEILLALIEQLKAESSESEFIKILANISITAGQLVNNVLSVSGIQAKREPDYKIVCWEKPKKLGERNK